jgi:MinD superfamily P-loop ATPase
MTLIDAPPGTSCPVIEAVRDSDFVLLVTEPTPFGLHDLRLAVEMIRRLGYPFGVVINREGAGDGRVDEYCAAEGIAVLLRIPDDRRIAEAYSRGEAIVAALPEYRKAFRSLYAALKEEGRDAGARD